MKDHIYILPEPKELNPNVDNQYQVHQGDMPAEIDSLNAFSEVISDHFNDPDFFDPFSGEKLIDDVYLYFVFNYLKVLQNYINAQVTQNEDGRFIVIHFDYLYGHFARTTKSEERKIDKAIELITSVYDYFDKNKQIEILGSFESAEDMLDYYQALKNLYYGDPTLYLEVIGKYL